MCTTKNDKWIRETTALKDIELPYEASHSMRAFKDVILLEKSSKLWHKSLVGYDVALWRRESETTFIKHSSKLPQS